ncbi:MAG: alpha/beta fold hydrolase [Hydrogenophaga sp.]|uniref:alpha/beta fold hydrolase n=1 Tax=Hydrogenophaga sp. TaxID=1904254 RepID=UPI00271D6C5A|nr:alpha/beta fold hydrolase [Hydrogenophaga sp.]MDO9147399.1 alpha/beta fold hydrolase [Hydrogenophaga sp.]MDO9606529.1 alpha/beta fold hydrolase [Hydrogenophaga sp.]
MPNQPIDSQPALPYHRSTGAGPAVVCIHCNASSSAQWRPLMDQLAPRHLVLAPDTHGAGRGPAWPAARKLSLSDEVDLLEPLFRHAGEPVALVGHSYGGAVALLAALRRPDRVSALVLYEPTLFTLIDAASPQPNLADGIRETVGRAAAALAAGDRRAAATMFIDYWMGEGAYVAKPEAQRIAIEDAIVHVQGWLHALLKDPTPLVAFRALKMPVLLMQGSETTDSARAVAALLAETLPHVKTLRACPAPRAPSAAGLGASTPCWLARRYARAPGAARLR